MYMVMYYTIIIFLILFICMIIAFIILFNEYIKRINSLKEIIKNDFILDKKNQINTIKQFYKDIMNLFIKAQSSSMMIFYYDKHLNDLSINFLYSIKINENEYEFTENLNDIKINDNDLLYTLYKIKHSVIINDIDEFKDCNLDIYNYLVKNNIKNVLFINLFNDYNKLSEPIGFICFFYDDENKPNKNIIKDIELECKKISPLLYKIK